MNIIITMAGLGKRFSDVGYKCPKYMIEACGKTLFEWSMMSLLNYNAVVSKYIFVVLKESNSATFIKNKMKLFGDFDIDVVELDEPTDGQATTALLGVDRCCDEDSILIFNIDTYIEPNNLLLKDLTGDGHIPCFKAEGNHWSFVKEFNGKVVDVVEKKRISDNCSVGAYYFKNAKLYRNIYNSFYGNEQLSSHREKYIAPMYKYMIDVGYTVTYSIISPSSVHVLGTPEELNTFISEYQIKG